MMLALLTASLLVVVCAAPGAAQRAPQPTLHTVTIDATRFSPATLTIRPGDSIEWVNKDLIPHTATTAAGKQAFDSGVIPSGKSWRYTFKSAGEIPYTCTFHPMMKATVRVKK